MHHWCKPSGVFTHQNVSNAAKKIQIPECSFPAWILKYTPVGKIPYYYSRTMGTRISHILIAEDDGHLAASLSFILKTQNYRVSIARNGIDAFARFSRCLIDRDRIDLLICDIHMPLMNGEELLLLLHTHNISIPVLMMTGYDEHDMIVRLRRAGYANIIDKPFCPDVFLQRIESLLAAYAETARRQTKHWHHRY